MRFYNCWRSEPNDPRVRGFHCLIFPNIGGQLGHRRRPPRVLLPNGQKCFAIQAQAFFNKSIRTFFEVRTVQLSLEVSKTFPTLLANPVVCRQLPCPSPNGQIFLFTDFSPDVEIYNSRTAARKNAWEGQRSRRFLPRWFQARLYVDSGDPVQNGFCRRAAIYGPTTPRTATKLSRFVRITNKRGTGPIGKYCRTARSQHNGSRDWICNRWKRTSNIPASIETGRFRPLRS